MLAASGPTWDQVPAFQWSTSPYSDLLHMGHPDRWDFPTVHVRWGGFLFLGRHHAHTHTHYIHTHTHTHITYTHTVHTVHTHTHTLTHIHSLFSTLCDTKTPQVLCVTTDTR